MKKLFSQFQFRDHAGLAALAFVAAAVRLFVLSRFSGTPSFVPSGDDMKFYHDWALRVLAGHGVDGHAFYGLPGYAWLLAGVYGVFGVNPWPVGIIQSLVDAFTAVCIALLATAAFQERMARPERVGWVAALGWIAFTPAAAFSIIVMPTSWAVAAFWGLVWWIVRAEERATWRTWLGMGAVIGAVSMLVATVLMLLPLVVARVFATAFRQATRAMGARIATVATGVALVFAGLFTGSAPVWTYNRFVAHEPVFLSAHSGLNFWIGNNPQATGYPKIPTGLRAGQEELLRDSITVAEREAGHSLTRAEVSRYWTTRANEWIGQNRGSWRALLWRKFENFWNAFQYDDLSVIAELRSARVLPPGLHFGIIAALGIPGLLLAVWRVPRARWIAAAVLLHLAALMPVFITERYRLCAVPGLLIFASYALWSCWDWLCARQWLQPVALAGTTACSAMFVAAPRGDISLWSLDHYNIGIRAQKNGESALAERELQLAYAYVADNAEVSFALGTYWHEHGDRQKAKAFYRHALSLNPQHANAWNNLGVTALEEKFWAVARRCFEMAVRFEPEDAKAHFLLARAASELGDRAVAREQIKEALRLRPGQRAFEELQTKLDAPE